ncbi:MAG: hypothetical protein SGARI_002240 [Bacillariaceae sp.]
MKLLNVKLISPSYPGHGGSDSQPFRRIHEWPLTDLVPILQQENVHGKFMIQGASYGTAHAMATAVALKDRVSALGLQVPYLPAPICRDNGFHTDEDMILSEQQCQQPWIRLPILSLFQLCKGFIPSGIAALPEGAQATKDLPDFMHILQQDTVRSFLRGVVGQSLEMTNAATTQYWPDPTLIDAHVVAVWYAQDDGAVPPAHGQWLAKMFQAKQGSNNGKQMQLDIRAEQRGWGHFSYFSNADTDTGMQTQVLLEMLGQKK